MRSSVDRNGLLPSKAFPTTNSTLSGLPNGLLGKCAGNIPIHDTDTAV